MPKDELRCNFIEAAEAGAEEKVKPSKTEIDPYAPNNVPTGHRFAGKTIREIASILNISLGEARRRKAAGAL